MHQAAALVTAMHAVRDRLQPAQQAAYGAAARELADPGTPWVPTGQRSRWQADIALGWASLPQPAIVSMPDRVKRAVRNRDGQPEGSVETDA